MIREYGPSSIQEMQKSQAIRLWDVFFLGPFLIHISRKPGLTNAEKLILGLSGALAIIYNGRNYIDNRKIMK